MTKITSLAALGLLMISFYGHGQSAAGRMSNQHAEVAHVNPTSREIPELRTEFTRTYLNDNKTKTTLASSVPLHYLDNGKWLEMDYRIAQSDGRFSYPATSPFFEMAGDRISIATAGKQVEIGSRPVFEFEESAHKTKARTVMAKSHGNHSLLMEGISPNIDRQMDLYHGALKYSYILRSASAMPESFARLSIAETLSLPKGFTARKEIREGMESIVIANIDGTTALVFQPAIVTDSKMGQRPGRPEATSASYELIKIDERTYTVRILVDGNWLTSPQRVFPIAIDPVVTVNNTDVINSCFTPNYQAAPLQVNIPAGETILTTDLSYDFVAVAGSGAWMSDQRSFVAGPNGQTPVQNGTGNSDGLLTYNITASPIGNGISTGTVTFNFNFARNWGGSGCNATFNFANRRTAMVTYGTIEYGDGPLVINEYSASNRNFNDGFGRNEDWIELYNASPDTYFNLAGYHLSNNIDNPTKWQIESGVIPPNSRVLVFCSNRDIASGTVLHANFDLSQLKPDEVVLADPDGNILESHEMYVTQTNHSYGRTTDGASGWSVFTAPTPGNANAGGSTGYAAKPEFGLPAGKYPGPVSVTLSTTGTGEQIRYTTNGSTPTAASPLYTGPISVTQSTVIRARSFSTQPGILPGFIETNTYFINDNSTLPVFSLSGDPDLLQLFNGNGGLEPTGYVEYFESDGTLIDENMGDFDQHGNDSWAYAQRGVDFISRDDHGYKRRLEHQFFSTTDRQNFRRLIMKAAGSDNYPHQSGGGHFRDLFAQTLSHQAGLELDERSGAYVNLFVNGQYWGIYDIREKVDDNQYTDHYYQQDYIYRDSDVYLQYIKTWGSTEAEFGNQPALDAWQDLLDYVQDNDMSVEANYNYVESQLNIDSLVDYFVLNSYLVNRDWLNWNTSWWRGLDPEGGALKWRYALWDMDGILGHYVNYTGVPDTSANAEPCQVEDLVVGVGHTQTIKKLIDESPIARQKYITRYADLLNTHLSCENATAVFDSIVAVIAPEMPRQIQRWGGSMATWQANILAARNFLLQRCSQTISTGMVNCYDLSGPYETTLLVEPANSGKIKMNSEWLSNFPFTASIFGNIETLLKAEANPGYEFSHWEVDGAVIQPDAESPDIVLQISQATTVTAHYNELVNIPDEVIYYWHFNDLETPADVTEIAADFNLIPPAQPLMTYTGEGPRHIDATDTGSLLNLHQDQGTGNAARVRNPSDGRTLVFDLPTTGYKDIKFAYAVQRTNSGQLTNHIFYSVDGSNYIQGGLAQTVFNVGTEYSVVDIDFSAIDNVNKNPDFKIMIGFEGNTTAENGNNRFDNITLKGTELELSTPHQNVTSYQIFPNPFKNVVQVISSDPVQEISVFDMIGKKIATRSIQNATHGAIDLGGLNSGVYLMKVKTSKGVITHKLVRE